MAVVDEHLYRPPFLQQPSRFWTQAGKESLDSGSRRHIIGIVNRRSQLYADFGDFGASMAPGVDPGSVPTTGVGKTRPPRKPTIERFFFTDGDSDGDPNGQGFFPVLEEAGAADHAAYAAAAAASTMAATDSAKARAQTTAAIAQTMAELLWPVTGSAHTPLTEEVKQQHHHYRQGATGIPPRPPRPNRSCSRSKSLGHDHGQRSATMARIAALAARARFSSDLDEHEAQENDHGGILGGEQPGTVAAAAAAAAVTAAAVSPRAAADFSSVSSGYSYGSDQGREHGNRAL